MLTSIAFILLLGLLLGSLFQKLKSPSLIGMILTGMILGPHILNLLDQSLLDISPALRQLSLVVILTRAGLSLNIGDLKKVGRPAILMCFVPACFEMLGIVLVAPRLLGVSVLDAGIMGATVAAVSPAVIVPFMLRLMDEGYGVKKSLPQMILAGSSVDDVFVIVVFTSLTTLASTGEFSIMSFGQVPTSILLGMGVGALVGYLLGKYFRIFHMRDSVKILIVLSLSFLMIEFENQLKGIVSISGLLAIMSMGVVLNQTYGALAKRLANKYNKLWVFSEVILFVLVGATVNLGHVWKLGVVAVLVIVAGLLFRTIGVYTCLIKTKFNKKEKLYCSFAYMPKATVQAAIGTIPLTMGLACGDHVLTIAVMSILIAAPLGSIIISNTYKRLLTK